jgi:hypothetical protein
MKLKLDLLKIHEIMWRNMREVEILKGESGLIS